jgi:hypothetical protein
VTAAGRSEESRAWVVGFALLAAVPLALALIFPFFDPARGQDHYIYLAHSFAGGELSVDALPPEYRDYVPWEGHKYLPFGPLPGLLLIPFLPLLDTGVPLVWVGYLFTALNVYLLGRVLWLAGVRDVRVKWAVLLLFGGAPYFAVAVAGISTYLAHLITVTFVLLAMWEMLGVRRLPLVGLFLGLAGMTRLTSVFTLPFFIWLAARPRETESEDAPGVAREGSARSIMRRYGLAFAGLALGLAGPVLALALYNYARFGSPTESGYGLALLYEPFLEEARRVGLFSLAHVPRNLQMMLVQWPTLVGDGALRPPYLEPWGWGMSLFLTTPAIVYAFRAYLGSRLVQACWLGIAGALVPILTYYGIGWVQFGYRYALDFMPFLVLLTALGWRAPMTNAARVLVIISVIVSVWGSFFVTAWL